MDSHYKSYFAALILFVVSVRLHGLNVGDSYSITLADTVTIGQYTTSGVTSGTGTVTSASPSGAGVRFDLTKSTTTTGGSAKNTTYFCIVLNGTTPEETTGSPWAVASDTGANTTIVFSRTVPAGASLWLMQQIGSVAFGYTTTPPVRAFTVGSLGEPQAGQEYDPEDEGEDPPCEPPVFDKFLPPQDYEQEFELWLFDKDTGNSSRVLHDVVPVGVDYSIHYETDVCGYFVYRDREVTYQDGNPIYGDWAEISGQDSPFTGGDSPTFTLTDYARDETLQEISGKLDSVAQEETLQDASEKLDNLATEQTLLDVKTAIEGLDVNVDIGDLDTSNLATEQTLLDVKTAIENQELDTSALVQDENFTDFKDKYLEIMGYYLTQGEKTNSISNLMSSAGQDAKSVIESAWPTIPTVNKTVPDFGNINTELGTIQGFTLDLALLDLPMVRPFANWLRLFVSFGIELMYLNWLLSFMLDLVKAAFVVPQAKSSVDTANAVPMFGTARSLVAAAIIVGIIAALPSALYLLADLDEFFGGNIFSHLSVSVFSQGGGMGSSVLAVWGVIDEFFPVEFFCIVSLSFALVKAGGGLLFSVVAALIKTAVG